MLSTLIKARVFTLDMDSLMFECEDRAVDMVYLHTLLNPIDYVYRCIMPISSGTNCYCVRNKRMTVSVTLSTLIDGVKFALALTK